MSQTLPEVAPTFVEMAHRIVWATAATVDRSGRPWTRVLHPLWQWDGEQLVGWVAVFASPIKRIHLQANPYVSLTYWHPSQDTANAYCAGALHDDDATCQQLWDAYKAAPEPVGYDPVIIEQWRDGPQSPAFSALRLDPWRLYVQPSAVMMAGQAELRREWRAS